MTMVYVHDSYIKASELKPNIRKLNANLPWFFGKQYLNPCRFIDAELVASLMPLGMRLAELQTEAIATP